MSKIVIIKEIHHGFPHTWVGTKWVVDKDGIRNSHYNFFITNQFTIEDSQLEPGDIVKIKYPDNPVPSLGVNFVPGMEKYHELFLMISGKHTRPNGLVILRIGNFWWPESCLLPAAKGVVCSSVPDLVEGEAGYVAPVFPKKKAVRVLNV